MSFLVLNQQNLELGVRVGVLESYKPNRAIKKIHKEVEGLRSLLKDKASEITGKDAHDEINAVLGTDQEKMRIFQEYLRGEFNENVSKIMEQVKEINKVICPEYAEALEKQKAN